MKMETVIRSPQDGVIKKLAHKEGVSDKVRSYPIKMILTGCRTFAKLEQFWSCLKRVRPRRERLKDNEYHDNVGFWGVIRKTILCEYMGFQYGSCHE
jgi:hypothetical protein